jgi:hypothetical protein
VSCVLGSRDYGAGFGPLRAHDLAGCRTRIGVLRMVIVWRLAGIVFWVMRFVEICVCVVGGGDIEVDTVWSAGQLSTRYGC